MSKKGIKESVNVFLLIFMRGLMLLLFCYVVLYFFDITPFPGIGFVAGCVAVVEYRLNKIEKRLNNDE